MGLHHLMKFLEDKPSFTMTYCMGARGEWDGYAASSSLKASHTFPQGIVDALKVVPGLSMSFQGMIRLLVVVLRLQLEGRAWVWGVK